MVCHGGAKMDDVMSQILDAAFEEEFGEILKRMPKPPKGATLYERLYNYARVFFMEGLREGIRLGD
jgi:hypothetical protein